VERWLSEALIAMAPQGARRSAWLAGRVLLAQLLDNGALPLLQNGSHGKPWHPYLPEFNISNSADAVAVLTGNKPVGCDMELLRPRKRWQAVAKHSFSPALNDWLEGLPEAQQLTAFWRLWTAHEAVVKQRGGTVWQIPELSLPLETLCPPNLHLQHITCGEWLIACCGSEAFAADFSVERAVAIG
jgi:4'-phosphopantetheinyl transferase